MAPEQARGKAVDRRADIWAFGVVLFEMLTGRQMFAGETVSDTIARILERQPDWGGLPSRTPARVRELLRRCLEKDAKQRLRDMGDARLELEAALAALASGKDESLVSVAGRPPAWWPAAASVALLVVLMGGWALHSAIGGRTAPPTHVSLAVPDELVVTTMMFGRGADLACYASARARNAGAATAVYRRSLDDFEWQVVRGSEGKQSWDMSMDGRWLYVIKPVAEGSRQLELQRIALEGSAPPVTVMPWGADRTGWEVLPDGRVFVVERGNKRFAVLEPGSQGPPAWRDLKCDQQLGELMVAESLEDGKGLLVSAGYYGANGWMQSTGVIEIATGALTILQENSGSPQVMPGGRLLMSRGGTLLAAPWDARGHRLTAPPVAVMQGLRTDVSWGNSQVRTSPAGDLGIVLGAAAAGQRGVVLARPGAQVEPWNDERRAFEVLEDVSPDGRFLTAVAVPPGSGSYEVLLLERGRTGARRFAAVAGEDCSYSRFSPDGRRIAWTRQGSDSTTGLYLQPVEPGSQPRLLLASGSLSESDRPCAWYPDGRALLVRRYEKGRSYLRRVTLAAETVAVSDVVREAFDVDEGAISPDGRRLAYVSYEGSDAEVVVTTLGADGRAGQPVRVSRGYGEHPHWIRGGAALVWSTRARVLMTATVSPSLEVSAATKHLDLSAWIASGDAFTVLPDGSVAGIARAEGEGEMRHFDLVLGYGPELKRAMERATRGTP
jgi:serine/threonine-protein kinase